MADTTALMRQRILDMAIRGELVEQRGEEEAALEMIKNAELEKEQLIINGKVKKEKKLSLVEEKELSYNVPNSWEWARLGNITNFIDYRGKTPTKIDSGIRLITAKNVRQGYISFSPEEFINADSYDSWMTRGIPRKGDILFTTEAPLGYASIINIDEKFALAQRLICIQPLGNLNNEFLCFLMQSGQFQKDILTKATGTTVTGIKAKELKKIPIAIPPLKEQERIVAKIEEIFSIIDQIGTRKEVSLAIIEKIRQKSLQNAIMGQLVEQNENDEPASELFKKIHFEKEQMIISKNVKKPKPLKFSAENENEYDIPLNWEWTKLDDIAVINRGASPRPIKAFVTEDEDGVNWIKIGDSVRGKKYIDSVNQKITKDGAEKSVYVSKGDLIMSNSMSFGYAYIMNTDGCIHDGWLSFKLPKELVDINWMHYMLNANYDNFEKLAVGTGVRNLNIDRVRSVYVGLPPLAEQYRIVEKLDQIMAICDQMQNILDGSSKINEALKVTE